MVGTIQLAIVLTHNQSEDGSGRDDNNAAVATVKRRPQVSVAGGKIHADVKGNSRRTRD